MARKPKTAAPVASKTAAGLVMTINKIIHGKGKVAPAKSPFFPASSAQREELFRLGAVREPTEAEAALFGVAPAAAPAAEDPPPPPAVEPAGDDDGDPGEPPADQDPLG